MQESQDRELLRQYVRENSDEAFAALVSRHVNMVYSAALRKTGNPVAAEEVTQAVFVILAKKANGLIRHTALTGWLYQAARLTAANFLRTEIRRTRREQEAYMQSLSNQTEPEIWPQIMPLLEDAMGRLGEKDRNALALRFFEGKSFQEIGTAFGVSENAARKRTNYALEKLRTCFSQCGVTSTTETMAGAISANSVQAAPVALAKTVTAVAIAKGATASISTLTLIKGALKIMAWTKAKTAIVISATVILGVGTTTIVVEAIRAMHVAHLDALHNIQGTWEGVMPLGEGIAKGDSSMTHIVLKLSKSNGGYNATADAIDLGRKDIQADGVVYKYPTLEIVLSPRTTYHGIVNARATQITFEGSVMLKHTTTPAAIPEPLADSDFAPKKDSVLQGYWKGTLGTKPDSLPLNWKIAGQADGTFRAEMDNPMRGANGQPASVVYHPPEVKLILMTGSGMFQGELNNANTELTGSWVQGGISMPSVFRRADYEAERASEPIKDYSHASKNDLQGHWKGSWILPLGKVKVSIRYALDIAKLPDGTFAATLANLDQLGNSDPIPASDFQYSPPALHMSWKWADDTKYDGKLENGKLVGTWSEGGGGFPLVFEREN